MTRSYWYNFHSQHQCTTHYRRRHQTQKYSYKLYIYKLHIRWLILQGIVLLQYILTIHHKTHKWQSGWFSFFLNFVEFIFVNQGIQGKANRNFNWPKFTNQSQILLSINPFFKYWGHSPFKINIAFSEFLTWKNLMISLGDWIPKLIRSCRSWWWSQAILILTGEVNGLQLLKSFCLSDLKLF